MAGHQWIVTVLAVCITVGVCSCSSGSKPDAKLVESGERWILVGEYATPRVKGPPEENWIGTLELPKGSLASLVDVPMKTPDGGTVLFPRVTYNEPKRVLICSTQELPGPHTCEDVWRHDLATGQSRWIAKGKWNKTRGFAWSPDGNKVAFVASTRGSPAALVVQYDLDADRLEEVTGEAFGNRDDPQEGDSSIRPRRPVYSEDGNWLYYVSVDRHVMVVNLRTRDCTKLPFSRAVAVLTVKGAHLIYSRELATGRDARFEVVKVKLDAPDDLAAEQVHSAQGVLWGNYVSPSRRFVLLTARVGYGSETRLIDVDQGVSLRAEGLSKEGFTPQSTAWTGRTQRASRKEPPRGAAQDH